MIYPAYMWWTDPHPHHAPLPHGCCNHTTYCYANAAAAAAACPYSFQPHYPPPPFYPPGLYSPYYVPPQHYEYDNHHHCCGCNHKQPSQADNKTSDSLLKDYPIMWPNHPLSVDHPEPSKQAATDIDKSCHEPLSLKNPQQGGNGEVAQDEQGNRFPFQIFWLPSKNDLVPKYKGLPDENTMKNNQGECETTSMNAAQKLFPTSTNEETSSNNDVQKVIPVKQATTNEEKNNLKSIDTNSDSLEKTDNRSRASKIPPVCLRVDPLPKKKKTSRSPSPREKERSNGPPVNSPKSSQQQAHVLKKSKEEQNEGNIKTVDNANKVKRASLADNTNKVGQTNLAGHGDLPRKKGYESEKGKVEDKKNMSEHEAALVMQSVYRGFQVRKSQPLKKLRQINEVRKQVSELRNRILDLETSSSTTSLLDGKKSVTIGETIMSLLLKLDTIQGLHPFVREVRKSVAKELVGLQEKLDSLVKPETPSEGTSSGPQRVMHPEDDRKLNQEQAQIGLCENREHKDDAKACNTPNVEQQLEKITEDDSIQNEFDQAPTESDTAICENHEAEATVSQEGCNTIGEPQLESHEEKHHQAQTECDEVKATESQEGCSTTYEPQLESHKEKTGQETAECNEALGLCETHEVEATVSQEGCNTSGEPQLGSNKEMFDQAPTECDGAMGLSEIHEVRSDTQSQEGCITVREPSHEEKLDQAPTECNEALGFHKENQEVEATESQEGLNAIGELQLDSHEENLDQAPTECDEALGLDKQNHEVEATESQEGCNSSSELDQEPAEFVEALGLYKENHEESHAGCNTVGKSHKEKCDQAASECEVEAKDNGDDMKPEDDTGEVNKKQSESEDLVSAESMMQADDKKNVVESGDVQMDMVSEKANEGDGRLMEENEKLRAAVEELMKAGNEQLGVIRELTGRVKDLEKKLSKKKKKVKVNRGRRVRDCVV